MVTRREQMAPTVEFPCEPLGNRNVAVRKVDVYAGRTIGLGMFLLATVLLGEPRTRLRQEVLQIPRFAFASVGLVEGFLNLRPRR